MVIVTSARFAEHTPPPGHPERIERAAVFSKVAEAFRVSGGEVREPREVLDEDVLRVHTAEHLDAMRATDGQAVMIDPDTFTSPESWGVARLAAGAAVDAARHAWTQAEPAVCLVRPPGHHAEPDRAMGFCLVNNVAIAAAVLRAEGAERVAIVDFDVHHGNGTQSAFYADPTVLYVSSHQFPFYPGTGAADETGTGPGKGATLNIPLSAGATDDLYRRVYEQQVVPALERFKPDLLLVSAGFDAHARDPLGQMRLSTAGYLGLVDLLADAARRLCGGRSAWVTEGGYHLGALEECLTGMVEGLRDRFKA